MLYPTNTVPVQLHSTDSSTLNVQPLLPNNSNQWQKPCTSVVQTNSPGRFYNLTIYFVLILLHLIRYLFEW